MGKEGRELWDDSALINAFDKAISNYKIMHGKGGHESSFEGEKVISSTEQNLSAPVEESNEAKKRDLESDDKNNAASNHTTEIEETINNSSVKGNHSVDDHGPGHYMSSSNGQNVYNNYLNTQCVEDYNHLLNQYYELEEQRQKILQKLYQFGSWNYQGSDSSVQWGTFSASQHQVPAAQASCQTDSTVQLGTTSVSEEHQVPAAQASYPTVACSCCSYACPCFVGTCTSLAACTSSGACTGKLCYDTSAGGHNGKLSSIKEDDLVKKAMVAADRALSSLKTKAPGGLDISEDKETTLETDVGKLAQGNSTETDLTVVFNAWYSAGFYTCKYLMEQSVAKK